jgi:hypothetical protein
MSRASRRARWVVAADRPLGYRIHTTMQTKAPYRTRCGNRLLTGEIVEVVGNERTQVLCRGCALHNDQARALATAEGLEIAEVWFYSPECSGVCKATFEPVDCSSEHPCVNCQDFMYVLQPVPEGAV